MYSVFPLPSTTVVSVAFQLRFISHESEYYLVSGRPCVSSGLLLIHVVQPC